MPDKGERVDAKAFRQMQQGSMGWREWEDAFDGLLREGGWEWWADRVVPVARIRSLLQTYRVPKPVMNKLIGMIQSLGRIPGLPDRVIAKNFRKVAPPEELMQLIQGHGGLWHFSPIVDDMTIIGFVELKSGKGKATPEQAKWLRLVNKCPGCFSAIGRPEHSDYWREVLVL